MLTGKLAIVLAGILFVVALFNVFGPGPLMPGLGPMFDQLPAILLGGILLLIAVPWLGRIVKRDGIADKQSATRATPLEILRERYARGEVTREQFLHMHDDLCAGAKHHS